MRSLHARKSWPTIRPLIIESDEEHPSYSQECRWVLFFPLLGIHLSRSWRSRSYPPFYLRFPLRGNESWSDPTRVRFNPALLPLLLYPPAATRLLRQASAWFITALPAASYKCSGTTLLLRSSFIAAERRDSSESRWLFLASLNEHQVEISKSLRPLCGWYQKKNIHLRITSNGIYLSSKYNL